MLLRLINLLCIVTAISAGAAGENSSPQNINTQDSDSDWESSLVTTSSDQPFLEHQDDTPPLLITTTNNNKNTTDVNARHSSLRSSSSSINRQYYELDVDVITDVELEWPWNRNKNKTDNACHVHQNCTACTSASHACHWCAKDEQCHAIGSWYGCAIGASCNAPKKNNDTCSAHTDCTTCTLSSSLCHWCAFDEQCHAIGSIYGCSHGVNCYSNDRCKRSQPEHIDVTTFEDVGFLPVAIIVILALGCMCCSTVIYAGASALKGAVDEITDVNLNSGGMHTRSTTRVPPSQAFANHSNHAMYQSYDVDDDDGDFGYNELGDEEEEDRVAGLEEARSGSAEGNGETLDEEEADSDSPTSRNKKMSQQSSLVASESHDSTDAGNGLEQKKKKTTPVRRKKTKRGNHDENEDQHEHAANGALEGEGLELEQQNLLPSVTAHPDPSRLPVNNARRSNGALICLLRSCRVWYFFTVVTTLLFATSCVIFWPKAPTYNVCSDEFAWKSIIDGLTSLKVEGSFELLISVENKNRLDIALEGVGGTFHHDDVEVGTFEMKRSIIKASSITDVLITCTVVPSRWEALGLISDYWKGKLVFVADVSGMVKIRGIGISLPVKLDDVLIKVNDPDMKDRHLCACPEWKDVKPTGINIVRPALPFNEAVRDPVLAMTSSSVKM